MGTQQFESLVHALAFAKAKQRQHYFTRTTKLWVKDREVWQIDWDFQPFA
jgi:hypothetical protein